MSPTATPERCTSSPHLGKLFELCNFEGWHLELARYGALLVLELWPTSSGPPIIRSCEPDVEHAAHDLLVHARALRVHRRRERWLANLHEQQLED